LTFIIPYLMILIAPNKLYCENRVIVNVI
jgi:hypothetical protein